MYYTNSDLMREFGFSRQTCQDLVGTKGIPLFPAAHGQKNKHAYRHNLYNPKSVAQVIFLLNQQEGNTYDEQARNLIKSVNAGTSINFSQEEFDMFYDANTFAAVNRKLDDIMTMIQGRVSAPVLQEHEGLETIANPMDTLMDNVHATGAIKQQVQQAIAAIIQNLHTLNSQTFRKANVIDLVGPEASEVAQRMRKDKDAVWEHSRKLLMREGYLAQGPTRDTLVLGHKVMNDVAPVQENFNASVEGHA